MFIWLYFFFFFKQKTAYEMRISDWSSDVCSSDLLTTLKLYVIELSLSFRRYQGPRRHRNSASFIWYNNLASATILYVSIAVRARPLFPRQCIGLRSAFWSAPRKHKDAT